MVASVLLMRIGLEVKLDEMMEGWRLGVWL